MVITISLPDSVTVVVAGHTVVVVYVVSVVVFQRGARKLARAVVAKAKIANEVLILKDRVD